MKLKGVILAVIFCSILALILQVVGLILKHWMYAPSVVEDVKGKNVTFYTSRGLWQIHGRIVKYKYSDSEEYFNDEERFAKYVFKPADLDDWFKAVGIIEVIGAFINVSAMVGSLTWFYCASKCNFKSTCPSPGSLLAIFILSGILDLLGVTILIGKLDAELTSWAGTLCGLAGTFSIIAASFIRYSQQEEYAI